jgi:hypothetical protein
MPISVSVKPDSQPGETPQHQKNPWMGVMISMRISDHAITCVRAKSITRFFLAPPPNLPLIFRLTRIFRCSAAPELL